MSPQAIKEFKEIYRDEFNEELSDEDALNLATKVINLFKIIYKPIPKSGGKNG